MNTDARRLAVINILIPLFLIAAVLLGLSQGNSFDGRGILGILAIVAAGLLASLRFTIERTMDR